MLVKDSTHTFEERGICGDEGDTVGGFSRSILYTESIQKPVMFCKQSKGFKGGFRIGTSTIADVPIQTLTILDIPIVIVHYC